MNLEYFMCLEKLTVFQFRLRIPIHVYKIRNGW